MPRDPEQKKLPRPSAPDVPALRSESGGDGEVRFPPVLQFLTSPPSDVLLSLRTAARQSFAAEKSVDAICSDVYHAALELGYQATIGVQEVYSSSMPSFPGQTVRSALLMVDLQAAPDEDGSEPQTEGEDG